ncbi:MAG: tetratricopeptide repeat protein [Candidatus Kerfeldbacteria bacterium]
MQLFDWIVIGILGAALITLIVLLAGKWKRMLLLDLDAMPKAKLRSKKYRLIEERLQRKTRGIREATKKVMAPAGLKLAGGFQGMRNKLSEMEKKYKNAAKKPQTQEEKEISRQKIAVLIEEGTQLFKDENYSDAEQIFLEAIRLNPKEEEAYEYLGEIYFEKKEYDHAIETLNFAKTLNPNDDRIYYDLGKIYETTGEKEKAMEMYKKCVDLSPKNPRDLDSLLNLAIELKDGFVARKALRTLKEVNPENQKLEELEKMVEDM